MHVHRQAGAQGRSHGPRGADREAPARRTAVEQRLADLALQLVPAPRRVLCIGAGSADLLRRLAAASPTAVALVGVEEPRRRPPPRRTTDDERLRLDVGTADSLRYADGIFDLVVCTASFDRWADQPAGLAQCARVLSPGAHLVLAGRFSTLRAPTLRGRRRARSRRRAGALLGRLGFGAVQWHDLGGGAVRAVTATATRDLRVEAATAG